MIFYVGLVQLGPSSDPHKRGKAGIIIQHVPTIEDIEPVVFAAPHQREHLGTRVGHVKFSKNQIQPTANDTGKR